MQLKQIPSEDYEKIGKLFSIPLGKDVLEILNKLWYNTVSYSQDRSHADIAYEEGHRDMVQIFRNAVEQIKKEQE